eukprot:1166456-Heterocapsa_arctica.AAC.1
MGRALRPAPHPPCRVLSLDSRGESRKPEEQNETERAREQRLLVACSSRRRTMAKTQRAISIGG